MDMAQNEYDVRSENIIMRGILRYMIKISRCGNCKNFIEMKDDWLPCCKAFPDGKSIDFEEKESEPCNDGIGFEEEE